MYKTSLYYRNTYEFYTYSYGRWIAIDGLFANSVDWTLYNTCCPWTSAPPKVVSIF